MYICSVCVQVWVDKCVQRREREREELYIIHAWLRWRFGYLPCLAADPQ